jgi:hypothetical protein
MFIYNVPKIEDVSYLMKKITNKIKREFSYLSQDLPSQKYLEFSHNYFSLITI